MTAQSFLLHEMRGHRPRLQQRHAACTVLLGGYAVMHLMNAVLFLGMALSSAFQEPYSTEWNKKSTLSTDKPVEFPGIVLEPGTYIVRLKESSEARSTVEILNKDETQLLAVLLTIPDHEQRPDDNAEFVFFNAPQGDPQPVRTWFYSGDLIGLEFVYPKPRAKEIAKAVDDHVMASNSTSKDSIIVAMTPNGKEVVIDDPNTTQTARRKPTQ
jgi:hypothetical protein